MLNFFAWRANVWRRENTLSRIENGADGPAINSPQSTQRAAEKILWV
jgi:hypothetical protein